MRNWEEKEMEKEIMEHFSHDHPLSLQFLPDGSDPRMHCDGCQNLISGPSYYSCKECRYFYLHKVCAELPNEMNHPLHPQHPLTLLARPPYESRFSPCDVCRKYRRGFVYHCSICRIYVHTTCAAASYKIEHFSHQHPLFLKVDHSAQMECNGCGKQISGLFYNCKDCDYYCLHMVCAELPNEINHPTHHEHPLTLLDRSPYPDEPFTCTKCRERGWHFVYHCSVCKFDVDMPCAAASSAIEHFSHPHPLLLKDDHSAQMECDGCSKQIRGRFYSCKMCGYYLCKVCAELPKEINHPMHPQHPLTLLALMDLHIFRCYMCRESGRGLVYRCSICKFDVDMTCAAASYTIKDKCHMHPLCHIQLPISFPCHICRTKAEGIAYKCAICPFLVHQSCTLLPETVKCSDHHHSLILLDSIPNEYHPKSNFICDICHSGMTSFETVYACAGCLFFAHASCAISSSTSRDNNTLDLDPALLPVRKGSTSLISFFVKNFQGRPNFNRNEIGHLTHRHELYLWKKECLESSHELDMVCAVCAQPFSDPPLYECSLCAYFLHESCIEIPRPYNFIDNKIDHFAHDHPLYLHDGHTNEEPRGNVCEACAEAIQGPSYGCTHCDYFLHKYCIELPGCISHPFHPKHKLILFEQLAYNFQGIFSCSCCGQLANCFGYACSHCQNFYLDLKCASILGSMKHVAHKHALTPRKGKNTCSACNRNKIYALQCTVCNFSLCSVCAMLPPVMNHRYCKHGFTLTYSPIENYWTDYYCDLCEEELQPKFWFYYCGDCDQFAHPYCLTECAADSNIKYGKRYKFPSHEHEFTLKSFTHDYSKCKACGRALNRGFAVGYECAICDFKLHLNCRFLYFSGNTQME